MSAQTYRPALPSPAPAADAPSPDPDQPVTPPPAPELADGTLQVTSTGTQESDGDILRARDNVRILIRNMDLSADEIEYNQATGEVEARGNVQFHNLASGEQMSCEVARYNVETETGTFYNVKGTAPARIEARPGLLTTSNPFYFEGEVAEKLGDRYILRNGFFTDCTVPNPWWRLGGSSFDVVPGDRAIARGSWLYVKKVPVFYAPFFYKSLEKQPRRSGFLTPNIGNSSLRGQTLGAGYFWAINRSWDVTYRTQFYSQRGFAHQADLRALPTQSSSFDASVFGVATEDKEINSEAGYVITLKGQSEFGKGWVARGEMRELSSFKFRQEFTQSFDEAVSSETHSIGLLSKHWSSYGFNFVAQRNVNFQSTEAGNAIVIRKLPEVQFLSREHAIGNLPVWVSLDSSFGLLKRSQPLFQTRQFMQRADIAPRVMTAFHWAGFNLAPSFGIRQTVYDSRAEAFRVEGVADTLRVRGENLVRSTRDVTVELTLPSVAKIFKAPVWMGAGDQIKHVVEPRATYRYVTGVQDFNQVLRFDETDLVSNTNEVEFSLTNRILARDGAGGVRDLFSWQLWYKRYFDPTFGGAVEPGRRNVIASSADLTGAAFLNGPRNQSPVVSVLRLEGRVSVEWRADYDPVRKGIVNSGASVGSRLRDVFVSLGHYQLRTDPVLAPNSNQLRGQITYGGDNRQGWGYGFAAFYDYRAGALQYTQSQVTYNTDCCGFNVQYRRVNLATRGENQFRIAFVISNIGSFGTLKPQERIF